VVVALVAAVAFQLAVFGTAGGKLWEMTDGRFRNGFIFGALLGPGWLLFAWMIKSRRQDREQERKRSAQTN
jgi:hypothetical protein